MPSALPNSPRCAEPTLSTTPTRGRATRHSRAMCPRPAGAHLQHQEAGPLVGAQDGERAGRCRCCRTRAGSPSAPRVASTWPSRSLVEVLPEEPVIASVQQAAAPTSRACTPAASRPSASTGSATTTQGSASSGTGGERADRPGRGGGRQEVARRRPARRRRRRTGRRRSTARESSVTAAGHVGVRATGQLATGQLGDLGQRQRDHAGAPVPARTSRSTVRSSKGCTVPATSWPVSWPLPATSRMSPGLARRDGGGDRGPPVADLVHLGPVGLRHLADAGEHRGADRRGVLGAWVVVGHDQDIARAGPQRYPSPPAFPDRGRRRSRAR